ncbi:barstar family protein [Micromonospora sp. NBC_01796]|uniref:barstar family protein n=1 Tax=Micromonospora sp. NBC_01796 TaxID=2975987 RepID=UPI002DDC7927|nr:barstar family protein [Micromonospora sp. NBC_01796]WSA88029.1 barstar family protein [Micromonospora sp. NBC_01796]
MAEPTDPHLPPWLSLSTEPAVPSSASVVSGAASRTRDGLFTEWAAALDFPPYFGRNWDALLDALRDLAEARPYPLVVTDAAELLADEPPAQLATLLAVIGSVGGESVPALRVVLTTGPGELSALHERLAAALA